MMQQVCYIGKANSRVNQLKKKAVSKLSGVIFVDFNRPNSTKLRTKIKD